MQAGRVWRDSKQALSYIFSETSTKNIAFIVYSA